MNKLSCLVSAVILVLSVGFPVSLEEAQRLALEKNLNLSAERIEKKIKKQETLEKLGELFPTVNFEASFNIAKKQSFTFSLPGLPPQEFVFLEGSYPKFTLFVEQDLFNVPKFEGYRISKKAETLQDLKVRITKLKVLTGVRKAYVRALQAKALVEVKEKHLELVKTHLRNAQELFKEGLIAFKDVLEAKVKLYQVKEELSKARADYRKALLHLSYLVGTEVEDVQPVEMEGFEEDRKKLLEIMERNNPALQLARRKVEILKLQERLAKSLFLPTAGLELAYQRTEESELFPKDRYFVSFFLRWNAFSGLRRFRRIEIARLSLRRGLKELEDIREKLKLRLYSILEDIESTKARIKLAQRRIEEAKEHLKVAEEKFKEGLGTSTEVLEAQSYLITARRVYEISKLDLILNYFRLLEVLGKDEG